MCSYHRATGEELTWPGLLFLSNTLGLSYRILFISCVCGFGSLHSLVCQICNGDEETCLLALRWPGGVNKHHGETKEGKHSCSIWLKDGLAWVGLKTEHPPPHFSPSALLKKRDLGRKGQWQDSPHRTPKCLCSGVYFLCVVCPLVCVRRREFSRPDPASRSLTVKHSLHDGWALCINSLSEPMAPPLKIDHEATRTNTHQCHVSHTCTYIYNLQTLIFTSHPCLPSQPISSPQLFFYSSQIHRISSAVFPGNIIHRRLPFPPRHSQLLEPSTDTEPVYFAVFPFTSCPHWPRVVCVSAWPYLAHVGIQEFQRIHLFFFLFFFSLG